MTLQDKIADAKSWYQQETKGNVNYLQSTRKDSILIQNELLFLHPAKVALIHNRNRVRR